MTKFSLKVGLRVVDTISMASGSVTAVYPSGSFFVRWDNGLAGSWPSWEYFVNCGGREWQEEDKPHGVFSFQRN